VCAVRPLPSLQLLLQDPFYLIGIEFPPLFFSRVLDQNLSITDQALLLSFIYLFIYFIKFHLNKITKINLYFFNEIMILVAAIFLCSLGFFL
jgi:hypothetical protein